MGQRYTSLNRRYGACEEDEQVETGEEDDRLLYSENGGDDSEEIFYTRTSSFTSSDSELQDGVRKMEAISKTWTQRSLIVAYLG
jgi:hypothetical protein